MIAVATAAAYAPITANGFAGFDDEIYVIQNPDVLAGLRADGVRHAFSLQHSDDTYWHPLAWLSLMLDAELFGPSPLAFHLMSVALHLASALVLLATLRLATGVLLPSAVASLLFAVHPLQVEAVAWAAERKTVLACLLGFLALLSYVRYAQRPSLGRYLPAVLLAALSLMAKPLWITLPAVLLLLDGWPLDRLGLLGTGAPVCPRATPLRLLLEKLPFVALSAGSLALSLASAVPRDAPLALRLANALAVYPKYVGRLLLPIDLAVFYPYPTAVPAWKALLGALFLAASTAFAISGWRRRPAVAFGWFWFAGTLVPGLGLTQTGLWPEMADRFMYVPAVGLFVATSFGLAGLVPRLRAPAPILAAGVAGAVALALVLATRHQLGYWRNAVTLFTRAIDVSPDNPVMQYDLGSNLGQAGDLDGAERALRAALPAHPDPSKVLNQLGNVHLLRGDLDVALAEYRGAAAADPRNAEALYNLGLCASRLGRVAETEAAWRSFLAIAPPRLEPQRREIASRLAR